MKIRNILAIAAILLGTVCSCHTDSPEQGKDKYAVDYPVTFDVLINGSGNISGTKGVQLNTTDEAANLTNYVSVAGSTFKVASFNNSDGSRFIPEPGAGQFDEVLYNSTKSEWAIAEKTYTWQKMDEKIFYAYANMPTNVTGTVEASVACEDITGATLTYTTVPADAVMQNDILLGYYMGKGEFNAAKKKGGMAQITFYHPMTAVKFAVGDFDGSLEIKSIQLRNVYKGGTARITPASAAKSDIGDKVTWTSGGQLQNVTLCDDTSALPIDGETKVIGGESGVFLLIPQDLTAAPVSLYIRAVVNGVSKFLWATISTGKWKAGCTNTYTINYDASNVITAGQEVDLTYDMSEGIDPVSGKTFGGEWEVGEESGS